MTTYLDMKASKTPRRPAPSAPSNTNSSGPDVKILMNNSPVNPNFVKMPSLPITVPPSISAPSAPDSWLLQSTTYQPELQWLMPLDRIIIRQTNKTCEAALGLTEHIEKEYEILDASYNFLYSVSEDSTDLERFCLGRQRSCTFRVCSADQKEVFRVSRSLKCDSCLCPCCLQNVTASANGKQFGSIVQNWNMWRDSFSLCNEIGETVLRLKGPVLWCSLNNKYEVKSADDSCCIGSIYFKSKSMMRRLMNDFEFHISFPQNLIVEMKATIIAACFLVDLTNDTH